jgi:hypothetical protein
MMDEYSLALLKASPRTLDVGDLSVTHSMVVTAIVIRTEGLPLFHKYVICNCFMFVYLIGASFYESV